MPGQPSANSGLGSLARARARATHPSTCRFVTMCFGPACLGHLACVPAVCGPAGPGPGRPGLGPGPASPGPAVHQQCAGHAGRGLAGLCLGRADLGLGCPRSLTVWHLTGSGQLARTRALASHLWRPANNVPGLPFAHCCLGSLARARTGKFALVVFSVGIKHCFSILLHINIQTIAHSDIISSVCLLRSS